MTPAAPHMVRSGDDLTGPRTTRASDVAHLLRRAGFGATPGEIIDATRRGLDATLDLLVEYEQVPDTFTPPPESAISLDRARNVTDLTVWWLNRMLTTPRPLQEKMTLFWHGHFATGIQKVRYPGFMYAQNKLFRDNALGKFDDILSGVYKDPAMLIWLDGRRNTRAAPNENFAREVMELFTLGQGKYTEDDVHAGARAFTGWILDEGTGTVTFNPRLHDTGVKTYLGQTGNFDGEDAVRILAAHPATGPFLAGKLWRFFASDTPPTRAIQQMAEAYYSSGHSIRAMVSTMFSLPGFYSDSVRTGHIKSPTEFTILAIRQLGITNLNLQTVPRTLALLGQELFNPPNVGGWSGGPTWINSATMLGRFNLASQITGDFRAAIGTIDTAALVTASGAERMGTLAAYIAGLVGINPGSTTAQALATYAGADTVQRPDIDAKVRGLVHLALVSPEFQVS